MASVNRVFIIGNLGQDPETRYLPSGDAVANISVATNEKWKDKSGEEQEHVEWHRVAFFGKLAEIVGEYLHKGSSVYVEGKIRTRKWQDKDGNDKYSTEIIADRMQMLSGKRDGSRAEDRPTRSTQQQDPSGKPQQAQKGAGGGAFDTLDDDIPF